MGVSQNGLRQHVKLEDRLTLLAWLNDRFGFRSNRELLADLVEANEGFDAAGRSFVYQRLLTRGDKVKVAPADLARSDDNIHAQR